MSIYLHDIPLPEARMRFEKALAETGKWQILGEEEIPLDENAVGRVLALPIWAKLSSPGFHSSAMDGFAVRAEETVGAMPTSPVSLKIGDQAFYVDTGDPLPDWANAVVPIELVETLASDGKPTIDNENPAEIRIRAALTPWTHIRPMGEDIIAAQLILPRGQVLRPADLGAIAACGHTHVTVSRPPLIAIIPTGSELIPLGQKMHIGEIIEFNSIVLAAQVRIWGGIPHRFPIIPDNLEKITEYVRQAAEENDLVLLNAGSSAGSEDFSAEVIENLGEILVHGVAVRPGHPVILGMIVRQRGDRIPIVGVPGYPVSAALTGEIFIEPLLAIWTGRPVYEPQQINAVLTRKITSPAGDDDYIRVLVGRVGEKMLAAPLPRGAGMISSLVRADGITILPTGTQGVEAGTEVSIRLYRPIQDLDKTIFAIGSHDMTLDVLSQFLADRGRRLSSANVGSQGGLIALRRGEAHLAGTHLLDPKNGSYNVSYLPQYLEGIPIHLMTWVNREQGLLVCKGNPKQIHGLEDLVRADVAYVNRQRGAGTRLLLDYHLSRIGINPAEIIGYAQEEYTHLSVAAAISSRRADCGLGIPAAAQALNLDFVPLFQERYDLVIPDQFFESTLLAPIFDVIQDPNFRKAILSMPGYDISVMGQMVPVS